LKTSFAIFQELVVRSYDGQISLSLGNYWENAFDFGVEQVPLVPLFLYLQLSIASSVEALNLLKLVFLTPVTCAYGFLGGMQEHKNLMGFLTRNSGQSTVRKGEGDFDGGEQCSGLKLFHSF